MTLTLDDDVVALLKREKRQHGQSFKEIVNSAIRRGLSMPAPKGVVEPLPSYRLKTRSGIDLDHALVLAAALDDEALLAKMTLGQ